MISFNLVTFIGNVGREPELQQTPSGTTYARFSLAVDNYAGKDTEKAVMWLRVTAWNNLADQVCKVVKKGSLVIVSGRLSVQAYTDKEQKERTSVDVVAHTVEVLAQPQGKTNDQVAEPEPQELPEAA